MLARVPGTDSRSIELLRLSMGPSSLAKASHYARAGSDSPVMLCLSLRLSQCRNLTVFATCRAASLHFTSPRLSEDAADETPETAETPAATFHVCRQLGL